MKSGVIVGADIGGTHVRIGCVDENNKLSNEMKISSRDIESENTALTLLEVFKSYLSENAIVPQAISIGFPSTINRERTVVLSTPNIKGLTAAPIKQLYEEALGIPVLIEKDACMLLHYDIHASSVDTKGMLIGCYIGTGLGNIILIDGKPWVGKNGVACELGHIKVLGKDDPCGCGNEGCLELYAGGRALKEICDRKFPGENVEDSFRLHPSDNELEEFVERIAIAVTTEINILDPDVIILGGGVIFTPCFPYEKLISLIHRFSRKPYPERELNIVRSCAGEHFAGVIGAGCYARSFLERK